jgi:hypothetical protein
VTARVLTMDDVYRDAEATHAWLRAHDLDPHFTAPGVVVDGDRITATVHVRDEDGNPLFVRDGDGQVIDLQTETVERQLRTPLPEHLGRWSE